MVVVLDGAAPGEKPELRRFSTMPTELHHLATWLRERGVAGIGAAHEFAPGAGIFEPRSARPKA
jgi:hypothetical protein